MPYILGGPVFGRDNGCFYACGFGEDSSGSVVLGYSVYYDRAMRFDSAHAANLIKDQFGVPDLQLLEVEFFGRVLLPVASIDDSDF